MVLAEEDGVIVEVDGSRIVVDYKKSGKRTYKLHKFERSNQDTCINQKPRVAAGEKVKAGDVLAEGPSTNTRWREPSARSAVATAASRCITRPTSHSRTTSGGAT